MNTQTMQQTFEILPLLGYELRKAGAYHVGPCPMCGGRDRFTVKKTSLGDRWLCRKCGDGRYHDAVYLVMKRDNVSQGEALRILGQGNQNSQRGINEPYSKLEYGSISQPGKLNVLPSAEWQRRAWGIVDRSSDRLFTDAGKPGRDYLTSRGLTRASWYAWHIGFASVFDAIAKRPRPAIVIPWITKVDEEITAIKYRYIDPDLTGPRYAAMPGSVLSIFGKAILSTSSTLFLTEGELNSISIWQCGLPGVDVLSFGSEPAAGEIPQARAQMFREIARGYRRVIVWCDDARRSKAYKSILRQPCQILGSSKIDNTKMDASALLASGALRAFLREVIGTVTLSLKDCEQVYEVMP